MPARFLVTWCRAALVVVFFFTGATAAWAQATAEVRGFLYNKAGGEPLPYATVRLTGTSFGAVTDNRGYFSLTRLPPGTYSVQGEALGFDVVKQEITLKEGEIRTLKLYVAESTAELETVQVSGTKTQQLTEVRAGVQKVTPVDIKLMPAVGGEADLAQFLQTVPGVVFTGDQGGQLYIRGGTPAQTLVLLDGMTLYNPFHSIGLFSVFDTDILRSVDVYTGGFNAEYGGRTSAVLDVTTRDGNRSRLAGKVAVNPFTSKLLLEGPLTKKNAETGLAGASFLLSGRTSYLQQTSKIFYEYANKDGLPFNFRDLYGKVSLNGAGGSRFNAFGFNFTDRVGLVGNTDIAWDTYGAGADFLLLPDKSSVIMHGALSYSDYKVKLTEPAFQPRTSRINNFDLKLDFTYFIRKNELKYGVQLLGNATDFVGYTPTRIRQEEQQNNTELAAFMKYRIVAGGAADRFVIEPSVRLHYYASLAQFSPEPRLGLKYNLTENIRLKAAAGLYTQNLLATRSDRDVVNLFAGYLSSPDVLQRADGSRVENRLQTARHLITGIEVDLFDSHLTLNLEPYVKQFPVVANINRDRFSAAQSQYVVEVGNARGVDLAFTYKMGGLLAQGSYSLTSVTRKYGNLEYRPNFDRRHNINLLAAYQFGARKSFEVSARWNLGSGFPFTPTGGFYEQLLTGPIQQPVDQQNGTLGVFYGDLNSRRLPYYHRLDFSARKTWKLRENLKFELDASVTNAYDRRNIFYFDRVTSARVDQLPVLPALGASLNF
ncbi:MAG: TonB-dependent receptor [Hymenobacteraceae bacterium]|nr:TonB-dependent receptor [Hymenobacteraceae bacterium]